MDNFERWGKIKFTDLKSGNKNGDLRGRPTQVALLNEQQATFLITLLRNNDVVLDFKAELVDQFYKMLGMAADKIRPLVVDKVDYHQIYRETKTFMLDYSSHWLMIG